LTGAIVFTALASAGSGCSGETPSSAKAQASGHPQTVGQRRARIPTTISFWTEHRGLVGTGAVNGGKFGGSIMRTSDGGRSFHRVFHTSGEVYLVETAGTRDAWAYVKVAGRYKPRFLHSGDGGRSWQRLPRSPAWGASFATPSRGLAVAGAEQASTPTNEHARLLSSSNGGRSWRQLGGPCPKDSGGVSYPTLGTSLMECEHVIGAGGSSKAIYASHDGGRSWRLRADCGFVHRGCAGVGLREGGYVDGLSFGGSGFGYLWGDTSYVTRDGGRRWARRSLPPGGSYATASASVLSDSVGVVLTNQPVTRLSRTTDAGRSWTVIHRWPKPDSAQPKTHRSGSMRADAPPPRQAKSRPGAASSSSDRRHRRRHIGTPLPTVTPGELLGQKQAEGVISTAILDPVLNAWEAGTRGRTTEVFAGGDARRPSVGLFVIFRDNHLTAHQNAKDVRVVGAGALRIAKAPLGRSVIFWAQRRGNLQFVGRRGVRGTLHLADDSVTIKRPRSAPPQAQASQASG
jgi:photosystem II stability/assembly factor-like uncharacterized protein